MTPTLLGRIQTRLFLALLFGVPATLVLMLALGDVWKDPEKLSFWKLPLLFGYVVAAGTVLDFVYIGLQKLRWDRDWPFAFQLVGSLLEGGIVYGIHGQDWFPNVKMHPDDAWIFPIHFAAMFIPSFLFLLGPMKVLFPRWRYAGGQLIGGTR